MRRVTPVVGALVTLLVVATVSGQSKADFSGKWTAIKPGPHEIAPLTLTVVQDATTITVSWPPSQGGADRISVKLDGSPGKFNQVRGDGRIDERPATAEWVGNKLVIVTKMFANSLGDYTLKQTWSLEGELLAIESLMTSDKTGADIVPPIKTTLRKQ